MRNFKRLAGIVVIAAAVLLLLDFFLYPCTFIRNDIHAVTTNRYDDVYLGTSHGKMNIDPAEMETVSGRTGHNLCVGGEYAEDTYYMTKLILETGHKPQRIVYEVSPGYFVQQKEEGNNYLLFFHEFPLTRAKLSYFMDSVARCNLRTMFFPWYEYPLSYELQHLGETVAKKSARDYGVESLKTESQEYHENGFIERYPVDTSDFDLDDMDEMFPEDIIPKNMDYVEKLIELCRAEGIEFTAVMTPLPDDTLNEFWDGYEALDEYYAAFFEEHGVRWVNFNRGVLYDLTSHDVESYTDLDGHMHGDAAREFSATMAEILESDELPEAEPAEEETEEEVEELG